MRACLLYTISFSIYFPIKGSGRYPKCREFKCFQIFVPSFPSFGNGFDSRRPLQILKKLGDNLDKVAVIKTEARKAIVVDLMPIGNSYV
jgi:hypothetical protein